MAPNVKQTSVPHPPHFIYRGRGRKVKIDDYTPQAEVVYRAMHGGGMSLGNTLAPPQPVAPLRRRSGRPRSGRHSRVG